MKKIATISMLALLSASCASIISGSKQELSFDSNEKNVEIFIDNKFVCKTPCLAKVERENAKLMLTARKAGYDDKTVFVDNNLNVMVLGNALSTVLSTFGASTDLSSGAFWEYHPNSFYITMQKEPTTAAEKKQRDHENKIRDFVLRNYSQLQTEAFTPENSTQEYLKTLSGMTNLPESEVRTIIESSTSEAYAAEKIVGTYIKKR